MIDALIVKIAAFVISGDITCGEDELTKILELAKEILSNMTISEVMRDNLTIEQLEIFKERVSILVGDECITEIAGEELIQDAQTIIDSIEL
ncbi:hypothetical protein [Clostridium sp. B9]|uniref:hypothetical protein n=1 Tax=Clostridium sp. B9 TaxID=3423224 RepID=UPI003D2EDC7E